ncbi:hypothetical protein B0E38_04739 [Streptomyces sp. 111WW2]|uniref:DUF6042 family protein n=1 Tax=Streptomyces sp. 111WW2 TaxID=1945515 RepID=UPI000D0C82E6|nr:DUF6042 family protein [Streptomyces sp. 111WW2]PSK52413.1 hypothetical protein B0E38_04739 [Streptomyces sp. 111WW2]
MTTNPDEAAQPPARLTEWSPEVSDRMARQHMAGGWTRAMPAVGVQILGAVASRGRAVTRAELGGVLPVEPVGEDRWPAPCWFDVDEDAKRVAVLDRYAAAYDHGPVRTCADLLNLLAAAGVLWVDGDRIGPVVPVPGVDEVFPVDVVERAEIARLRALAARL